MPELFFSFKYKKNSRESFGEKDIADDEYFFSNALNPHITPEFITEQTKIKL